MPESSPELAAANRLAEEFASSRLPPLFAKLYSQHTLLRSGQRGLSLWGRTEAEYRLADAVKLMEAGLIQRAREDSHASDTLRRSAELLEWLSHPSLNPNHEPLSLLSAALYQLAGYPARASGLIATHDRSLPDESIILKEFLRGAVPSALKGIAGYWAQASLLEIGPQVEGSRSAEDDFETWVVRETIRCLGLIAAELRWGGEDRAEIAIEKLAAISSTLTQGTRPFSWMLSKLSAEVGRTYRANSLRGVLQDLAASLNADGKKALERYIRNSYQGGRVTLWPSQRLGVKRILQGASFTLCTPTGSGKTTVAELAIIQSIFTDGADRPLALYLVPSRALATEVESRISKIVGTRLGQRVVVTGLYGGSDWGPTDAWLTAEDPSILICTYEKAEALLRFLGPLFAHRITLVILDEAHSVQFGGPDGPLIEGESRALRLESLGTRLGYLCEKRGARMIALSAVATDIEGALAKWVAGSDAATPERSDYRSTRQLVGRLECLPGRLCEIRYDRLDGSPLEFGERGRSNVPYVPKPFPPFPPSGVFEDTYAKRTRAYLLWAALHLSAPDEGGAPRATLISVMQDIGSYAEDFLTLLDETWNDATLPQFFREPTAASDLDLFQRAMASCADYFGTDSREYRLLQRGIILHHGRMPGPLARIFLQLVESRIINLVIATSTLTEGVNLPFETILVPSLLRGTSTGQALVGLSEFRNLVGRAGRPGWTLEGRLLVLLETEASGTDARRIQKARQAYATLLDQWATSSSRNGASTAKSSLARLLALLAENWRRVSRSDSLEAFLTWLETVTPESAADATIGKALDSLDGFLLGVIVELEQMEDAGDPAGFEAALQGVWSRTFARITSERPEILSQFFSTRVRALRERIYPDAARRRALYRIGLPPRQAHELEEAAAGIAETLSRGVDYGAWDSDKRLRFIMDVAERISQQARFRFKTKAGRRNADWKQVLSWWLSPRTSEHRPDPAAVADWHRYVNDNFIYRLNWGLGCFFAKRISDLDQGQLQEFSIARWPEMDLPWAAFWLKELITWGTLDPIAAHLLSHRMATTRVEAETIAGQYYEEVGGADSANEFLDATVIRRWARARSPESPRTPRVETRTVPLPAILSREFGERGRSEFRVLPIRMGDALVWVDPAGYELARSKVPSNLREDIFDNWDFTLLPSERAVKAEPY